MQWREVELRMAPRPLAWESKWMVAPFSMTGDTGKGAGAGQWRCQFGTCLWNSGERVLPRNGHQGQTVPWQRSCPRRSERESESQICVCWCPLRGFLDRKEPNGTAGLSRHCCSVGYLCCCLYISVSWMRRGARMTSCFWMWKGVLSWRTRAHLSARSLLPGTRIHSLWLDNLKSLLYFFGLLSMLSVSVFEMPFIFLFSRQLQIHALFSWENNSNKTVACFFHVGVDTDGCNETSFD